LGIYRFRVLDEASGALLYSRGFSSIFAEWVTTGEAGSVHRTFHESLRFPWPKQPVRVVLERRAEGTLTVPGGFSEVWATTVDPASRSVNRGDATPADARVVTFQEHGPAAQKVDLVLVAAGYSAAEAEKFEADARRLLEALWREEPFRSRRTDFN